MDILKLIASRNFISVNKSLARKFGLDAAVILGELAGEFDYFNENGMTYDGWFFSTIENVEKNTTLSAHKQRSALATLKDAGVVEIKYSGLPKKRYIRIDCAKIVDVVNNKSLNSSTNRDEEFKPIDDEKLNVNKNKEEEYINKTNRKEGVEKRKRFVPPTVEEVSEYCKERCNEVDPQRFVDYYDSNGWMRGSTKIKDWKACVRTWERNEFSSKPKKELTYDEQVGDTEEWVWPTL